VPQRVISAVVLLATWATCVRLAAVPADAGPTPIAAVKAMPPAEITAAPAVLIRGVVTRSRPGSMFVQDDTAGIYVNLTFAHDQGLWTGERLAEPAAVGDEVEIEGMLDRGGFSPPVLPRAVRVVGRGRLPAPRPAEPGRFFRGADDGDLVEITGVVQNVANIGPVWRLTVSVAGNTLLADVATTVLESDAEALVDGVLRLAGPTAAVFTTRGEFIMPRLQVDRPEWLTVIKPARRNPFDSPRVPLDGLARFRHEPVVGHRVCTEGVVVHAVSGRVIHIQDGSRGIRVQSRSDEAYSPGDRVEVAGFVDRSGGVAGLVNAVARRLASGPPLEPIAVAPAEILETNQRAGATALMADPGDYEGCLVRFPATLVDIHRTANGGLLVLDAAGTLVSATTDETTLAGLRDIRTGSELAVAGIARIQWGFDPAAWPPRTVEAVTLLVRSPADVAVVRLASWWTPRRLAGLVAAAAVALAGTMAWVILLRRQVRRQAEQLARELRSRQDAELEFAAALRERNRLAANLHDTVLQTVTGIGFQLQACRSEAVGTDGNGVDHSRIAERMVAHAIQQLRGTVWALHELPPPGRSLGEGLRVLAERLGREHATTIGCRDEAGVAVVDDTVASTLLLVAQEALHNALRHAGASTIEVSLGPENERGIRVVVSDDGRGFETGDLPGPSQGHFGIQGMIDRMQRIGGSLVIESRSGGGTRLTAAVPAAARPHLSDRTVAGVSGAGPIPP